MRVLALDTSGTSQSVAVLQDERCLHEGLDPHPSSHSETLLTAIDAALGRAGLHLNELDLFAVSVGPGSFTGLRIGLSTVKGLSRVTGIPVVGVSTLLALASPWMQPGRVVVPCLDARCGEVYASAYTGSPQDFGTALAERAWPIEVFLQHLAQVPGEKFLVGNALGPYRERFRPLAALGQGDETVSAGWVGRWGFRQFRDRGAEALSSLSPRYLRASEAENRLGRLSPS